MVPLCLVIPVDDNNNVRASAATPAICYQLPNLKTEIPREVLIKLELKEYTG